MIAEAYPTLGSGTAYGGICALVGPRAHLPSEGWRNTRGSLRRDLGGGLLKTLLPGLRFLRRVRSSYDDVVVVGDMLGVFACQLAGITGIIYLDVYKTGFGRSYGGTECWAIGKTARAVFTRHESLAAQLQARGVNARCAGNIMLDTVPGAPYSLVDHRRNRLALALLPGSRATTADNFALQAAALRRLPLDAMPDLFMAIAGSVSPDALAAASEMRRIGPLTPDSSDLGALRDKRLTIHLVRGNALGALLGGVDLVLSQAGTATVQALGLGRPVVGFRGLGERASRFRAEQDLFGQARVIVDRDPVALSGAVERLLADDAERLRLGRIGQERVGAPGAIDAVLAELLG